MAPLFDLQHLLNRRLIVVSGKGGVGKTTVSLSLGLLAAERGKKVIIAEINSEEQVTRLLERPPIGHQEVELLPRLWGINIHAKKSFEEYVLLQIKFKGLYRAVFDNRLVRHFIDATPGLADLMSIGKVYALAQEYDLVIVDAPATGHGIALLEIPSIVVAATQVGPLKNESSKIDDLLHDPEKTEVVLVTLPEELPVTEAIEMHQRLKEELKLSIGPLFLNQVQDQSFTKTERRQIASLPDSPLHQTLDLILSRSDLSEEYDQRLREVLPAIPIVPLPFLYSPRFGLNELEQIADHIEKRALLKRGKIS